MKDKPFALIGVNINCYDPQKLQAVMDTEQLTFRSFTDKSDGEGLGVISSAWNLMGTPTVFIVDHTGVIRYIRRGIPDAKAIDEKLNELIQAASQDRPVGPSEQCTAGGTAMKRSAPCLSSR
jgi:peroxiredoxin